MGLLKNILAAYATIGGWVDLETREADRFTALDALTNRTLRDSPERGVDLVNLMAMSIDLAMVHFSQAVRERQILHIMHLSGQLSVLLLIQSLELLFDLLKQRRATMGEQPLEFLDFTGG